MVFFKDMRQIVNILLQIGVWATPIMWNIESPQMAERLSPVIMNLLKLNPMYYIVQGYRNSLINKVGFWETPKLTIYFWVFTVVVLWLGTAIFKRLRPHFADVL